jgi:hypothetical protein
MIIMSNLKGIEDLLSYDAEWNRFMHMNDGVASPIVCTRKELPALVRRVGTYKVSYPPGPWVGARKKNFRRRERYRQIKALVKCELRVH